MDLSIIPSLLLLSFAALCIFAFYKKISFGVPLILFSSFLFVNLAIAACGNSEILAPINLMFFPLFLGPSYYLVLRSILIPKNIKIWPHFIFPGSLICLNIYNSFILTDKDIALGILVNALTGLLTLVYSVFVWIIANKISIVSNKISRIIMIFFTVTGICFLTVESIVGLIKPLYFTENLELVNLSVKAPRIYKDQFHDFILFSFVSASIVFLWDKCRQKIIEENAI